MLWKALRQQISLAKSTKYTVLEWPNDRVFFDRPEFSCVPEKSAQREQNLISQNDTHTSHFSTLGMQPVYVMKNDQLVNSKQTLAQNTRAEQTHNSQARQ